MTHYVITNESLSALNKKIIIIKKKKELEYLRIIEWFGVEGTLKII